MHEIEIIEKNWGEEQVVVNASTYCGKLLVVAKGWQCSLHHHKKKDETFYVQSGPVLIQIGDRVFMAGCGEAFRVPPGTWHRFGAQLHPALLVEFSSHHNDDDVVRHEPSCPITDEFIDRAES